MLETPADARRVRVGVVGVGKMGLSHLAVVRALDGVEVVGVCDSADYLLDVLHKYTGVPTYPTVDRMMVEARPDAVVIATPTGSHADLVGGAIERGVHVFCEKPLTLDSRESTALAELARKRSVVTQVGYHNRFVATFKEVKRLLAAGVIGRPTHILAEAYGPVVLKEKGSTWRSRRSSGGGCLYDYAAHPIDLVNWYVGPPTRVQGSVLNSIFSADTDDEVYATLLYDDGLSVQLSVNWSDESFRKMSTSVSISGPQGRIVADRQEVRVFLRSGARIPDGYREGWNVQYTTDLTEPVSFYLRGEEYSAQLETFIASIQADEGEARENSFDSAAATDRVIDQILADAAGTSSQTVDERRPKTSRSTSSPWWRRKLSIGRRR